MKNFKYKEKVVTNDEDLMKYKSFSKVLDKHQSISSSYKNIWKIWGGIGLASVIVIITFLGLSENKETTNNITASTNIEKPVEQTIILADNQGEIKSDLPVKTVEISKPTPPVVKQQEPAPQPVVDQAEEKITEDTILIIQKSAPTLEEYFHLNQKTAEERINLPTLFVAGKAWPEFVKKRDLIKKSSITAHYDHINKEVPIISYSMERVDPSDFSKSHTRITNIESRSEAAILREIHRSNPGEFILYKNIIVFIPGVGRMNMGDLKVEVSDDRTYNKRLRERQLISE